MIHSLRPQSFNLTSLPRPIAFNLSYRLFSAFFLSASNVPRVMAAYCLSRKLTRKRQRPGAAKISCELLVLELERISPDDARAPPSVWSRSAELVVVEDSNPEEGFGSWADSDC